MKLSVLYLANVHCGIDDIKPVAMSDSREKLEKWEKEQRADKVYDSEGEHSDSYRNVHGYQLTYKKGSPIQWFNPPDGLYFGGIKEFEVSLEDYEDFKNKNLNSSIVIV